MIHDFCRVYPVYALLENTFDEVTMMECRGPQSSGASNLNLRKLLSRTPPDVVVAQVRKVMEMDTLNLFPGV